MTVLLFLNELSHGPSSLETNEKSPSAGALVDHFVGVLLDIRRKRRDIALVTMVPLHGIQLGREPLLARWAADSRNRDRYRFLQSLRNRAPFRDVGPLGEDGAVSYSVGDEDAEGLGYAHAFDGLAVSLASSDRWNHNQLPVMRQELHEAESGLTEPEIVEDLVTVRHAARLEHVGAHGPWLTSVGVNDIRHGSELWAARSDLFPHLEFLTRVEGDLSNLGPLQLGAAGNCLVRLERAVARWNPALAPHPEWETKVTPEAEQRRRYCRFVDQDGQTRTFHEHARYTPGAGRIHFRIAAERQMIVVAYIGLKITRPSL